MKLEDIFKNEVVVLEETKVYEQKDVTDFDKETKHISRIIYDPEAFRQAFTTIIDDDTRYPTVKSKLYAITAKDPFWKDHLVKIQKVKKAER